MKYLILNFLVILGSCSMASLPNVRYEINSMINEFSLYDIKTKETKKCDIINNLIKCKVPNIWNKSRLIAHFKTDNLVKVFYKGEAQNSGVSYQDYSQDTSLVATNVIGESLEYVVRVRYEKEIVVNEANPLIKIEDKLDDYVTISFYRSPTEELMSVPEEDILYCYNIVEDTDILIGMSDELNKTNDFNCTDYYTYEVFPKEIELPEDASYFNILAVYDGTSYLYQRVYLSNNIEIIYGDCTTFINSLETHDNVVLGNDLNCDGVNNDKTIGDIKIYGNGYSISNFVSGFNSISNSILIGLKFVGSKNISNELSFTKIERLSIKNGFNNCIEECGLVSNKAFDLSMDKVTITGIVTGDDSSGLVTGLYVSNFPMYPFMFNDVELLGIVTSDYMAGGMFGFLISYAEIFNSYIDAEIIGDGYTGCVAGTHIDEPYLENVNQNCSIGE